MIGESIGSYRVLELIGQGGMGEVYRGVDLMLDRPVAIKALRPELAQRAEIVERFRTEAVALAKLIHPNIATLFTFIRHGEAFFMVMEFAEGESLDRIIARHPRGVPEAMALEWLGQTLRGIEHAHKHGVIHRDIKPANIMLAADGTIKVMDFGIARLVGTGRLTRTGFLIGTPEYMAPEQIKGKETDVHSDIYSLGVVLYELLTGRVPFQGASEFDILRAHIEEMPPPLRASANQMLSETVKQAVERAMAKSPEQRFSSARQFRQALETAQTGQETVEKPDPPSLGSPRAKDSSLPPVLEVILPALSPAEPAPPTLPATRIAAPEDWKPAAGVTVVETPRKFAANREIRSPAAVGGPPSGWRVKLRNLWRDYAVALAVTILLPLAFAAGHFGLLPWSSPAQDAARNSSPPFQDSGAPQDNARPADAALPQPAGIPRNGIARPAVIPPVPALPVAPPMAESPEPKDEPEAQPNPRSPARGSKRKQPPPEPPRHMPAKTKPAVREPKSAARAPDGDQQYFRSLKKDIGSFIGKDSDGSRSPRKRRPKEPYFEDVSKDIKRFLKN